MVAGLSGFCAYCRSKLSLDLLLDLFDLLLDLFADLFRPSACIGACVVWYGVLGLWPRLTSTRSSCGRCSFVWRSWGIFCRRLLALWLRLCRFLVCTTRSHTQRKESHTTVSTRVYIGPTVRTVSEERATKHMCLIKIICRHNSSRTPRERRRHTSRRTKAGASTGAQPQCGVHHRCPQVRWTGR